MPQNREVAGATMGAGSGTTAVRAVTFGPFGFLSIAVAVALAALFLPVMAFGVTDPFGLRWSWLALVFLAANLVVSRFAGRRGAETEARWRSGPRDLAYWTQKVATWVLAGLVLIAFVGLVLHLPVLVSVVIVSACGVTVGVAPMFFLTPPAARQAGDSGDIAR